MRLRLFGLSITNNNLHIPVLSLQLDGNQLSLWRNNECYADGAPKSAADDSYRLYYEACSEGLYESLKLHEAMYRVIDVLSGITESISDNSSHMPVSRIQLLAMASMFSQIDSPGLIRDLAQAYESDILSTKVRPTIEDTKR